MSLVVQVGHWLRDPNSLYRLPVGRLVKTRLDVGHPWEEGIRTQLPPAEDLDLGSVEVMARLSNAEYPSTVLHHGDAGALDLPLAGFPAQLRDKLVDHGQTGGPDGMAT